MIQFCWLCSVSLQVQEMRDVLNEEWVWFQQVLIDSDIMLQKQKEKFKSSLLLSYEELKKTVEATVEEFSAKGHSPSLYLSPSFALSHIQILCFQVCHDFVIAHLSLVLFLFFSLTI